jgi:hypothetical protein
MHCSSEEVQHFEGMQEVGSCLLLVPCLAYSLTLKMDVVCSSEMPDFFWTVQQYNSENCTFHNRCHENIMAQSQ